MRVIAQKIEEINKKLIELTSRLDYINLVYEDMDEEGKLSFRKENLPLSIFFYLALAHDKYIGVLLSKLGCFSAS